MRNLVLAALLVAFVPAALSDTAHAHGKLMAAQPPVGGTVTAAPDELALTFSEELNLKFTGVRITGPDDKEVQTDHAMLMDGDKTFRVTLPAHLAAGTYKVEWRALSRDGHKTHGDYTFTVKP